MSDKPFKMKGSPFQRNFGVGDSEAPDATSPLNFNLTSTLMKGLKSGLAGMGYGSGGEKEEEEIDIDPGKEEETEEKTEGKDIIGDFFRGIKNRMTNK